MSARRKHAAFTMGMATALAVMAVYAAVFGEFEWLYLTGAGLLCLGCSLVQRCWPEAPAEAVKQDEIKERAER